LLCAALFLRPAAAAEPVQTGPSLTIVKVADGDGAIGPGQVVRFTVVVSNTGTISVTGVTVQDDYDQTALPTVEALAATESSGAGGAQNDGDVITWQVGALEPGAVWRATYQATAAAAFAPGTTEVTNSAAVFADGVRVGQAAVTLVVRAPHLTLTRQRLRLAGEGEIAPGDTIRYTIRYGNNGTADAVGVVLEERFDETVVQQVGNIATNGQRDGATIRWNLGTVAAGASGEVSYELTLKPALAQGDIEVRNQATVGAAGVESVTAADLFALRTPLLSVTREREDLNGGAIQPGDTLRFTIRLRNTGAVPAAGVVLRDDFDDRVVAEVSEISAGGREKDGDVEWELAEPLEPGAERLFSYKVRLVGEIGASTTAANTSIVYARGAELVRTQTTMTIEPGTTTSDSTQPQIFQQENSVTLAVLVGALAGAALTVVGGVSALLLHKGQWQEHYLREVAELVAVIVIVAAVLILAMGSGIKQDGAVSILSGIAGYMLGRKLS